ncbi:helix-turn-helix transcriptional regulator [Flexivirga oryzae]|uniref:AraC-like DNA-binding protein n=1 Tax=Flexivirga oryzae TaxID=1794944 RepID=A0A839N944_9MICO|nr:AraC family transcriptional regulator [Flexivirga oryzae]MBB2894280.1 AraC-like DNA-binding protein [Flexivirga oryzae]
MSSTATQADVFGRYVGVLAETLDDHETSPAQLAQRLYTSRFHLDRIVSAVGGESPGALRRRLLLERAAYRLITTRSRILDVGVEAGYGSHEAFTRAFARHFNVTPREFRCQPTGFKIPADNGVHFQPPGGLRLPGRGGVSAMELLTKMIDHHIWLTGEFVERASRLTDEQLDERIDYGLDDDPDEMTLRRLLSRLVGQMGMWNAALADREYDWDIEQHETVTSLRSRLAEEGPRFADNVRHAIEHDELDDTFVDATCEQAEVFTYGGMIAHVLTFAAHRRTLVALALDKHGITDLGWGDPMRWVAERA